MIKIENTGTGYLIEDKILFTNGEYDGGYINLAHFKGESVKFGVANRFLIDFPGEYDIDDIFFKVYEGKENKLSYFFRLNGINIFLIQDPQIVERVENERIDCWLYLEETTEGILDKLELEGERIKLS
ncbi:MAG: hypothetical protein V3575_04805 [Candidatus Absconditabacteria bacterium]